MNDLVKQISQCQLCLNKLPLAPKPIVQLSRGSKILIAGQAPGIVTHEKGRPFDDKSGARLRAWLGVNQQQFYNPELFAILPMGFCYPGKGASGDLPPLPLCASTWRSQILAQLKHVELTVILGKYAIAWHLQSKKNITELAAQSEQLLINNNIVLPHPSPRNNIWLKRNPWFEQQTLPLLQEKVKNILDSSKETSDESSVENN